VGDPPYGGVMHNWIDEEERRELKKKLYTINYVPKLEDFEKITDPVLRAIVEQRAKKGKIYEKWRRRKIIGELKWLLKALMEEFEYDEETERS